jgi:hypothetical protein
MSEKTTQVLQSLRQGDVAGLTLESPAPLVTRNENPQLNPQNMNVSRSPPLPVAEFHE